jgi:hypothetical protein
VIEFPRWLGAGLALEGRIRQNSLFFSLLAGNFALETGSRRTASSGGESGSNQTKTR